MLKLLFQIILVTNISLGQSYLGFTNKNLNLRELPTTESTILSTLNSGIALFVISAQDVDGFFNVIVIDSNQEGFVHKSFVSLERELPQNTEGIFNSVGRSSENEPELNIFNNTNKKLTLKLNQLTYKFEPKEKRKIKLRSGRYEYRASAPGVIPDHGSEYIENNMMYEWEFYISRR